VSSSTSSTDDLLACGRIGRPHGLDGSFHVTRPRGRLLVLGAQLQVAGAWREVVRRAGTEDRPVLRLEGVDGREAVEGLRGEELWLRRADAPELEEDEWYVEDLVGLRVADGEREVGVVSEVLPLPANEVLVVPREGAPDLLVPLVRDAVRAVDVEAGVVDVDLAFLGEA
jgi:16S rRNA processing protein RimM